MSLSWVGLPDAVVRMKSRAAEREFRDRTAAMVANLIAPPAERVPLTLVQPEWARWMAQEAQNHDGAPWPTAEARKAAEARGWRDGKSPPDSAA